MFAKFRPILLSSICLICSSCVTQPIEVLSGLTSHTLCSGTFVSGLDTDSIYKESILKTEGVGAFSWALSYELDKSHHEVRTRVLGGFESRAVYTEGRGCTLVKNDQEIPSPILLDSDSSKQNIGFLADAPATPVSIINPNLMKAFDRAFSEPISGPSRQTKALLVIHNDRLIAERYAPGYGINTKILGWSATKSITATLIGVLVRKGKLSLSDRVPFWQDSKNPKAEVTIDQLLRMTSGIDFPENNSGGKDPVSKFLYTDSDVMSGVNPAGLIHQPGTTWAYTSGNTWTLARIIGDLSGGSPQGFMNFANRELFGPIGVRSAVLEFDAKGTQLSSTYGFATARDWARLGLLYLNDGVVNGTRILPEGWADSVASITKGSLGYGAGFWTNRGDSEQGQQRISWGMPDGSFYALGYQGQYVVIVPSKKIVIVKLGIDQIPNQDVEEFSHVVGDIVKSVDELSSN